MNAQDLIGLAHELQRRDRALDRLSWCYDRFLEFNRDGLAPTVHADGSIAMDATRSLAQLEEAIADVLGRATISQAEARPEPMPVPAVDQRPTTRDPRTVIPLMTRDA